MLMKSTHHVIEKPECYIKHLNIYIDININNDSCAWTPNSGFLSAITTNHNSDDRGHSNSNAALPSSSRDEARQDRAWVNSTSLVMPLP